MLFQFPRIAKPSGTQPQAQHPRLHLGVSTSPDSKAIRNHTLFSSPVGHGMHVSTSPDSKAIRNAWDRGIPGLFPVVSTSPDSKAIRNFSTIRRISQLCS